MMSEEGFQAAQNVNESAATSVYPAPRLVDVAPGLRRGKYNAMHQLTGVQ